MSREERKSLRPQGGQLSCGVDEAGRGCLAGPIFAAAVILDPRRPVEGLADSKSLSPVRREELFEEIRSKALAYGVAWATVKEIDARGIEWANRIAFSRAVRALLRSAPWIDRQALVLRIDGNRPALRLRIPQELIPGGDASVAEIAAASILAKCSRDRYVVRTLHAAYPEYGFDRHKGYATRAHREAIRTWGPTPHHRMSFCLAGRAAADRGKGEPPGRRRDGREVATG
mgnify:CR=1 FL=1